MNIYLVRHGQSQANISGAYCGITDVPLTSAGFKQTENTAEYLRGVKADRIYSSPLIRARELAERLCRDVIYDARICERNFGIWEGMSYDDICAMYPDESDEWNKDWVNYRITDGESAKDVEVRCAEFLDMVKADARDCIVITHSGIIRNMITLLLGMDTQQVWRFCADNGSVSHIEIIDDYAVLRSLNLVL